MGIEKHIELQQACIMNLNNRIATATSLGDVAELGRLAEELQQAETTLRMLQSLMDSN